jgi:hypothetical protein
MSVDALISVLLADAAIKAETRSRISSDRPEETEPKPYITLEEISCKDIISLQHPSGVVTARVQVNVYHYTRREARLLTVRTAAILNGYKNTAPDGTVIQACLRADRRYGKATPARKDDRPSVWFQTDYMVTYNEG